MNRILLFFYKNNYIHISMPKWLRCYFFGFTLIRNVHSPIQWSPFAWLHAKNEHRHEHIHCRFDTHSRPRVVGKGQIIACKIRRCRNEKVCGRCCAFRSAHYCFVCIYSQIATTTSITPKQNRIAQVCLIIHLYSPPEATSL